MAKQETEVVLQVGEDEVRLVRVPVETYQYSFNRQPVKKQTSRWAVFLNGVMRGYIFHPTGFGKPWEAHNLREPGTGTGVSGDLNQYDQGLFRSDPKSRGYLDRDGLARKWPEWHRQGKVPSEPEVFAEKAAYGTKQAQRKADAAANRLKWARENVTEAAKRVGAHRDTLAVFEGLLRRLRAQMTNHEVNTLVDHINAIRAQMAHDELTLEEAQEHLDRVAFIEG